MLRKIIFLLACSLFALKVIAAPTTLPEFLKSSEELRGKAKIAKDFKGKAAELKKLEAQLNEVRAEFKKKKPTGDKVPTAQHEVTVFYYSLTPLFEIAKKDQADSKECAQAERRILSSANQGKIEGAPHDKDSLEVIAWHKLLCD
ncbi:hypothetical protein D3C72_1207090 [compost metagenome]